MIHIIIPVFNRLNNTIKCLKSINNQINFNELNIIVVNDGSTDGTFEYLKKNYPKITILNGNGALYWGGAINYGVEYVLKKSKIRDWILILNNDIELQFNSIINLKEIAEKNKRKAVTIPLSISAKDKSTIIKSGTIIQSWFFNSTKHLFSGKKINELKNYFPINVDIFAGRCVLHPIELFNEVGNYDSLNFTHYGCDDEFSIRLKKYGYFILLCPSSLIYLTENESDLLNKEINLKKLIYIFFNIKSSSNIINKFKFALKSVPIYAKITFFLIGILKSFYIFLRRDF